MERRGSLKKTIADAPMDAPIAVPAAPAYVTEVTKLYDTIMFYEFMKARMKRTPAEAARAP